MKTQLRQGEGELSEIAPSTGTKLRSYLGIDPGVSGAWAFLTDQERIVRVGTYKNDLANMILGLKTARTAGVQILACVELAHAMPHDGKVSVGTYIEAYGIVQGILKALEVPFEFVSSNRWQKAVWDSMPTKLPRPVSWGSEAELLKLQRKIRQQNKDNLKAHCNEFVSRRWPSLAPLVAVKKNQGIADAVCIAMYLKKRTEGTCKA